MSDEQKEIGRVLSTKGSALHLIPMDALVGLAERFEQGVERKGSKAWNALSENQECLVDKAFLLDRISHLIHHAMKFRDQLVRGVQDGEESMYENAGAVSFGGALLLCAAKKLDGIQKKESPVVSSEPVSDWSLQPGKVYSTVGGYRTDPLIEFAPRSIQKRMFFERSQSAVNWLWDGTPVKVNMSLTDAQVEKYRISWGSEGVDN